MQGFRSTIRDGDWLVMRRAQGAPGAAIGQVVLILREDKYGDKSLHLKRIAQTGRRLWLRSDDPSVKAVAVTETDMVLATLVSIVNPESLAPPPHTRFPASQFAAVFGLEQEPTGPCSRVDGHLFLLTKSSAKPPKNREFVASAMPRPSDLRPAETAFLLLRDGDDFEYLGIVTFDSARGAWRHRSA